jgi:hypothetical protein
MPWVHLLQSPLLWMQPQLNAPLLRMILCDLHFLTVRLSLLPLRSKGSLVSLAPHINIFFDC